MENKISKFLKFKFKIGVYAAITFTIIILIAILVLNTCSDKENEHREITIEETPIEIESIMPKGDLYVGSAIIEDYQIKRKTESTLVVFKKEHTCVQIVKQKCSYRIDLNKIEYLQQEDNKILIKLPELEYGATTQDSPFISDDEEYWKKELPSTNAMKKQVAEKIKKRFDTPENRQKSTLYAKEAVKVLFEKLGVEVEFVSSLEDVRM